MISDFNLREKNTQYKWNRKGIMVECSTMSGSFRSIAVIFSMLSVFCCVSSEKKNTEFENSPLFGMLYDYRGQPCAGAVITIDGGLKVQTDINGRFVIQELSNGQHRLLMTKEGYENLSMVFSFIRNSLCTIRLVRYGYSFR